jgi:hypothetical protein
VIVSMSSHPADKRPLISLDVKHPEHLAETRHPTVASTYCYLDLFFYFVLGRKKRIETEVTYHDPCCCWSPLVAPVAEGDIGVSWAGTEPPRVDCSML